jgi:hypothetical protein
MSYFAVGSGSYQQKFTPTLNAGNVAANSVVTEAFTVTGVNPETNYHVNAPSLEAGLFIIGAKSTAVNSLTIVFFNPTGSDINPASQQYNIIGF